MVLTRKLKRLKVRFISVRFYIFIFSIALFGCMPSEKISKNTQAIDGDQLPNQNISQIIVSKDKGAYKFVERNVSKRKAFAMVQHDGRPAARIKLSTEMGGARDDWYRDGISGYGQRFEYGERKERAQKFNSEIWTTVKFWLPKDTVSKEQATILDFKEIRNGQTFGPLLNLAIRDDGDGSILKIKHQFEGNDCIIGRDGAGENSFCDKIDLNLTIGPIKNFTGRWVSFVSRAIWSNDENGAYDAWIDGRKVMGYRGNTSFGADRVAFKFGLYRIGLNKIVDPKDITIYFSNVGTAGTCEELVVQNCAALSKTINTLGYPNAPRIFRYKVNQKTEFLESGGTVLKYF